MAVSDGAAAHRIVVGIDGSPSSTGALKWALQEAKLTGSTLELITTWEWPMSPAIGTLTSSAFEPETNAREILDRALSALPRSRDDVPIESTTQGGPAGEVLVNASRRADLLVVGCRGHSEVVGLVLGSVSEHCVTHALCPVVVFREPDDVQGAR